MNKSLSSIQLYYRIFVLLLIQHFSTARNFLLVFFPTPSSCAILVFAHKKIISSQFFFFFFFLFFCAPKNIKITFFWRRKNRLFHHVFVVVVFKRYINCVCVKKKHTEQLRMNTKREWERKIICDYIYFVPGVIFWPCLFFNQNYW